MSDNGLVGRDLFLKPAQREHQEFDVAGFGRVRIQSLNEKERADFETSYLSNRGEVQLNKLKLARRRLITLCVVDGEGNTLLTETDIPKLEEMPGRITATIYRACRDHNGFDDEDLGDEEKN